MNNQKQMNTKFTHQQVYYTYKTGSRRLILKRTFEYKSKRDNNDKRYEKW